MFREAEAHMRDNIKMDWKEVDGPKNRNQWQTYVRAVMNHWVP